MMNTPVRNVSILALIMVNTIADQLTKSIVRSHLAYYETTEVIGKHLILTKIENTGAFLSTGDSMSGNIKFLILSLLPLLALCYGVWWLLDKPTLPPLLVLGISFVIGGGFGNLCDRIIYGSVTDFIHIDIWWIKTGIFNLADVSIMAGMIMILFNLYVKRTR